MNEYKGLRFWKWTVILLALCNICLLLVMWIKPHSLFGPPHKEMPRDFVIRNLKFTDDQVKKYDALISNHRHAMDQARDEANNYRRQLFENLSQQGKFNTDADSLARLIGNDQRQIEIITYNHFVQVRAICTDTQKTEFDKIIVEVTKMMHGSGHRGGPPHGAPRNGKDDSHPPPREQPVPPENE